ncbi:MAG: protein phosphatase CheZ, partial [Gammaproteobacteria bacterium]|nr:protein phosphatase CheZ [Gammaproteobacteria bacterium]
MESVIAESPEPVSEKLQLAKSLVRYLEAGNDDDAGSVIAELTGFGDSLLFQEIGRLTRELHDAINSFVLDARLTNIAQHEMPDAAERLRYVIATTEQAANTTLGAVEESLPLADSLRKDAARLADHWDMFNSRKLSVDDFRALNAEISIFLNTTQANSESLHQKLSEVLLAQSYQDLTGQVIRRVIDVVNDVESKLVELVRLSGCRTKPGEADASEKRDILPQGPVVPGVDKGDVV